MHTLSTSGILIEMKKSYLTVTGGDFHVEDAIYLGLSRESVPCKAKKPVVVELPHAINLGGRSLALVEYHPDLRTKGTLNGPTALVGHTQGPIAFRFMADEDMDLASLPWIVQLIINRIQL